MTEFYEAKPGMWLIEGVSLEEHRAAMAANWRPWEEEWEPDDFIHPEDEEIWVTRDGTRIPYTDLTDAHLHNILQFLEKRDVNLKVEFPRLLKEKAKREEDPS